MGDHTLAVQVPADDGSIERAFAELDARLTAWLTAMRDAQHAVSVPGRRAVPPETSPVEPPVPAKSEASPPTLPSPSVSPVSPAEPAVAMHETAAAPPPWVAQPAEPEAEVSTVEARIEATVEADAGLEPEMAAPAEPATPRKPKGIVAVAPPAAPAVAKELGPAGAFESNAQTPDDDEQALLASLDEETLKAIKVMRRLNPSNKTLRQLLEEYEASKTHRSAEPNHKKSWWKRGK